MQLQEIVNALEQFAPLPLQDGFDNAGLQIGLTGAEVTGALLCLDVTEDIIDEAVREGCNLIVSHHPLLFHGVKSITEDNYVGRCLLRAIRNGIAVYAAHTNLDNAQGGVNFRIAERLALTDVRFLSPKTMSEGQATSGSGVVGTLPAPVESIEFLCQLKERFGGTCVCYNRIGTRPLRTIAVCGGSGSFLIDEAIAAGADAFVTGEIKYHEYFGHDDILLVALGHYESERFTEDILRDILTVACPSLRVMKTNIITNPIKYI